MIEQNQEARLIIIGAGKMGFYHGEAALDLPFCEVVGVNSRTEKSAKEMARKLGGVLHSTDLADLVSQTQANCCVIAVSHAHTATILDQCLDLGLHCLVEKPVDLDDTIVNELSAKAKKKSLKVMVAVNRRFYSTVQEALFHMNYYGGAGAIHLSAPDHPEYYRLRATLSPHVYDNWAIMNTIHAFDLLSLFGGGRIDVVSVQQSENHGIEPGFNTQALLKGRDGTLINFTHTQGGGTIRDARLQISGSNYELNLAPLERLNVAITLPGTQSKESNESSSFKEGIREQLSFFTDCVVNDLDIVLPACTLEEHARVIEAMRTIFTLKV